MNNKTHTNKSYQIKHPDPYHVILFLITLFGLFIRLYHLERIPAGLFCDEAATGYDAYSILKTGRDSHGSFLPLAMNRFSAFDTAVMYVYFAIIPTALFGLSTFSVRLVAAIIGSLTICSTYLFAKELFNRKIGIIAALLIAVSPHHFIFSRWADEGILVPFFVTLALFFTLKAGRNPLYLIAASIVLGLSLYTYPIMKAFVPLIVFIVVVFHYKAIFRVFTSTRQMIKTVLITAMIFVSIFALPYYNNFIRGGNVRFHSMSVFNTHHPTVKFFSNMLSHLSPKFLFFEGDKNMRHTVQGFGEILPVLIPFILLGLGFSIYHKEKRILFLIFLFIAGLIPASLTKEHIPHALRTISAVPFLEIIAAYGMFIAYDHFKNKRTAMKATASVIVGLLVLSNMIFFLYCYFIRYPAMSESWFQYGLKEAVEYAEAQANNYERVIFSRRIREAYVFPLFYIRKDPFEYQQTGEIGKYSVCQGDIEDCYSSGGRNLFIVLPKELQGRDIKKIISYSTGVAAIKIVE